MDLTNESERTWTCRRVYIHKFVESRVISNYADDVFDDTKRKTTE